ncbi:hypothetical protein [Tardiphaga sp.]|uniref:hypothetical protein n=1 Tax=Tardiphaga sp. TaxID=1926292 RepID=UPI0026156A50|nr:hypothetical protein [Tardiphaga sp.]
MKIKQGHGQPTPYHRYLLEPEVAKRKELPLNQLGLRVDTGIVAKRRKWMFF